MRAAEQAAIAAGTSGLTLMERAGRGVAAEIGRRRGGGQKVAVICGPGNNGGDGYVVARLLADRGHRVAVYALVPRERLTGDAARMAALWAGPVHPPDAFLSAEPADVLVGALFGTGLSRDIDGVAAAMIVRSNACSSCFKVAVDIPSGIAGDTGAALGVAARADLTVTFHAMKPGHVLMPGRRHSGEVVVVDIGLGADATARARHACDGPDLAVNDGRALLARIGVDPDGHKYTKGHVLVLAGGLEGTGAARLAARGALRSGAGLVTLGVPPSALMAHAGRGPDALMVRRAEGAAGLAALLADRRRNAVVVGPAFGVGETTRAAVADILGAQRPVVLDADALTSFAGDAEGLAALTGANGRAVLTPHEGEYLRLFADHAPTQQGGPVATLDAPAPSKLARALSGAARMSAVMVLKGPDTVVAGPDGRAVIACNAPPWLGTAGSGDVLAGLIGGLLAQGLPPYDAARAGVWLHGEAGRLAGRGLIADDLPEAVRQVFATF